MSGAAQGGATGAASSCSSDGKPAFQEPSEADVLCAEFLELVRLKTRAGYEEAMKLSERILELEPKNTLVAEYQMVIELFLKNMDQRCEEQLRSEEAAAQDPNRTPSEVTTDDSEEEEDEEDDEDVEEVAEEVETEPEITPRR